jgi:uncharacterized BrkB/YihY/UPF0761 family membrane protein
LSRDHAGARSRGIGFANDQPGSRERLPLGVTIGWRILLKRTVKEIVEDSCFGLAAQLAYYFFLSVFPALLVLVALTSFFPPNLLDKMLTWLSAFAPSDVLEIVRTQIQWLLISLGFRFYVTNLGQYNLMYGAIGGVIVMLLWFYLSGLVLLIGAEFNSEMEHASPYGKVEGEKVPGEHRGWLFRSRRHSGIGETPETR